MTRKKSQDGIEFEELSKLLCGLFNIPKLPGMYIKHLKKMFNDGYKYHVITEAISISSLAILKNLDKPWPYHSAIIQNNLLVAVQNIEKKKQKELKKEEIAEEINNINYIQSREVQYKKKQTEDVSSFLD